MRSVFIIMEITQEEQRFYPGYYYGRFIPHGPFLEEWKDIDGSGGAYHISNYGRVKSLPRIGLKHYKGCLEQHAKEKILKCVKQKLGYLRLHVRATGLDKLFMVHRLVALHFLNNPENKPHVNHIRGITNDNMFTQIEWNTVKENRNHGIHFLKTISKKRGVECKGSWKSIIGFNETTGDAKEYKAVKLAANDGFTPQCISACLKNKRDFHKGYKWTYKYKKHASK